MTCDLIWWEPTGAHHQCTRTESGGQHPGPCVCACGKAHKGEELHPGGASPSPAWAARRPPTPRTHGLGEKVEPGSNAAAVEAFLAAWPAARDLVDPQGVPSLRQLHDLLSQLKDATARLDNQVARLEHLAAAAAGGRPDRARLEDLLSRFAAAVVWADANDVEAERELHDARQDILRECLPPLGPA